MATVTGSKGETWQVLDNVPGKLKPVAPSEVKKAVTVEDRIAELKTLPAADRNAIATALVDQLTAEAETK